MSSISFDRMKVELWIHGTASDEGTGGWASHLHSCLQGVHYTKTLAGYSMSNSSATRMTLLAVVKALEAIKKDQVFLHIYTSSPQVSSGLNKHIHAWAKSDFKKADGKDLQHEDLWRQVHALLEQKTISYKSNFMKASPKPDNSILVIHTASEYAQKAKKNFYEVAFA